MQCERSIVNLTSQQITVQGHSFIADVQQTAVGDPFLKYIYWYHECDKSIAEVNVFPFANIINCTVIHYMKDVLSLFDIDSWMADTLLMDK